MLGWPLLWSAARVVLAGAGQAAFAVLFGFFLGLLVGLLIAG